MRRVYHSDGNLWFLAGFTPDTDCTSTCVYRMSADDGDWSRHDFGETECAVELRQNASRLIVRVQSGLHDKIYALNPRSNAYVQISTHLGEIHTW